MGNQQLDNPSHWTEKNDEWENALPMSASILHDTENLIQISNVNDSGSLEETKQ